MELQLAASDISPAPGTSRRRGLFRRRQASGTAPVRPRGVSQVPGQGQGDAWALGLRGDFPLLARRIAGRRIVYLDSAATSQKPAAVIDAICAYYRSCNANIHRSVYTLAEEATALFEDARSRIARFAGGAPDTTIFTRNATEAINLVAYAWGRQNVGERDVVLVTKMEHHSNLVPWQLLCQETGAELRYVDVSADGLLRLDDLDAELASGRVRLAAVAHVSNVLGTINPVAEIVRRIRAAGAIALIDGSQAVPHLPVDIGEIGADFYAWTGHKALGPTGIGVLHGRRELLEDMGPFLAGGDMISTVDFQASTWNALPWKYEAGTSMIAEAIGLGAAVDYLSALGMSQVRDHELALTHHALERLAEVPGLTVLGLASPDDRAGVISFTIDGAHPHDVAEVLNRTNVCVRAGHHCAQPLMRHLGLSATTRVSFGPYNATDDIDALMTGLQDVTARLQQWGSLQTHSELAEHARHPRNFGDLAAPDLEGQASVELCGDDLGVHLHVTGGRVTAIRFHGHGCALAISAASYASSHYLGLALTDIASLTTSWALDLLPVPVQPIREPCAVLHLNTVLAALACDRGIRKDDK
jgi:cysteine desulfurase / selenocysteine lyase